MSLTYYLPEILFGCLAIVAILWGIMFIWSIFLSSKGKCSCRHCKGIASKTSEPPYYSCSLFPLALSMKTPSIILLPIYSQSQIKARFHLGGVPAGYKFIAAQNAIKSR